jgi:hypothetical protein
MGKLGRGRGGLAPEQQTSIGFKTERQKVPTTKGVSIGEMLVDGEQVKGEVSSEFVEVVVASERDATDRVKRNRVPRQYQKAVKDYFSNVQRSMREAGGRSGEASGSGDEGDPDSVKPTHENPDGNGGD